MTKLAYPFLIVAIAGFVFLLGIHISALFGFTQVGEHLLKVVLPGIFIVWLPTIFAMNHLSREFKQKEIWNAALRGCPKGMRTTLWIVCGYACVGAFVLPLLYGGGPNATPNSVRSLSAGGLVFYAVAVCVLYSSTQAEKVDQGRVCANGHRVSPLANFCEECGAPVILTSEPLKVEGQTGNPSAPR